MSRKSQAARAERAKQPRVATAEPASLFCGVMLLASTGLLLTPVIHRLLHRFHVEDAGVER